jgi:hypothetical protein
MKFGDSKNGIVVQVHHRREKDSEKRKGGMTA